MEVEAYCMKCKTQRTMQDAQEVTMDNGRRAAKGTCAVCGTKMTKFLPSDKSKSADAASDKPASDKPASAKAKSTKSKAAAK